MRAALSEDTVSRFDDTGNFPVYRFFVFLHYVSVFEDLNSERSDEGFDKVQKVVDLEFD